MGRSYVLDWSFDVHAAAVIEPRIPTRALAVEVGRLIAPYGLINGGTVVGGNVDAVGKESLGDSTGHKTQQEFIRYTLVFGHGGVPEDASFGEGNILGGVAADSSWSVGHVGRVISDPTKNHSYQVSPFGDLRAEGAGFGKQVAGGAGER